MLAEAAESDVVLLGECHDDPIAHSIEAFVLISLAARRDKCGLFPRSLEIPSRCVCHLGELMSIPFLAGVDSPSRCLNVTCSRCSMSI